VTTLDKINQWCDSSLSRLIQQYDADKRRASGKFERDLEYKTEETGKGYTVQILGSNYTYWMERGRNASAKFPPISAIKQWIEDKGIIAEDISQNSLAFLIARKIKNEGYKGKPTVASVLTYEWIEELLRAVGVLFTGDLKSEVIQILEAA
jgi:hypothetical protein